MNKSMPEVSSDSSSSSYSSDSSIFEENEIKSINIMDYISWNSIEGNLSKFSETLKQFSMNETIFLLKSRCLSINCTCNFKNHDFLLARVFVGLKFLVGKWSKLRFSKGSIPDTEKIASFIFFKDVQGWYEIMNENLEVIPFWNNVSQIVQNKPKLFLIRKDCKCLYIKDSGDDPNGPVVFDNTIIKAGSILTFSQCRKYSMKKGRKIKEQYLCKCKDSKGNCFYFIPEDNVYSSPIAGPENISGAHTFQSIIEKFHFPINVKPIFMIPPLPNLPSSDRHFILLSERFQFDLIVVTPAKDSSRLFLLTPNLFDDHVFTIGEFLPLSVTKHALPSEMLQHISLHQTKINNFFSKCHKYDSLSYLLKQAEDISKLSMKFEASESSEFDEDYIEVEGIYFYIRNGYFPPNYIQEKPKNEECPVSIEPVTQHESDLSSVSSSDESTDMSTTSSDSHKTSSTAMEMYNRRRLKQAKSMPLGKSKNKIENAEYNTSNSRCHLNFAVDNITDLSLTGVQDNEEIITKKITEIPKFYKNHMTTQIIRESDIDVTSLRDTMV